MKMGNMYLRERGELNNTIFVIFKIVSFSMFDQNDEFLFSLQPIMPKNATYLSEILTVTKASNANGDNF